MTDHQRGADRVDHGEAPLGEAQADNPPDDPEMLAEDARPLDTDVEFEGEPAPPPDVREDRGDDDPAPSAP